MNIKSKKSYNSISKYIVTFVLLLIMMLISNISFGVTEYVWDVEDNSGIDFGTLTSDLTYTNSSGQIKVSKYDNSSDYSVLLKIKTDSSSDQMGLYNVTVKNSAGQEVKYLLEMYDAGYAGVVPLASQKVEGTNPPEYQVTQNMNTASTSVRVPLKAVSSGGNTTYIFTFSSEVFEGSNDITINVTKTSSAGGIYQSNVPSTFITQKQKETTAITVAHYDTASAPEEYLSQEQIEELKSGISDSALSDEKGSWIEGILADIILGFGQIIQWIAEKAFGVSDNNRLTMDNLVFNRLDATVIDLRSIFPKGIQVGPGERKGILSNGSVVSGIQTVYSGLRGIAITIYIITLLYVGVRILMGVGTKDEAKVKKYVQYWATGVGLLFIVPYFLSAVPTINNALVEALGSTDGVNVYTTYTISQIAEELGQEYMGEDAEIPAMQRELNKRVSQLKQQGADTIDATTLANAENALVRQKDELKTRLQSGGCEDSIINALLAQIDSIKAYIDSNYLTWTSNNDAQVQRDLKILQDDAYKAVLTYDRQIVSLESQITKSTPQRDGVLYYVLSDDEKNSANVLIGEITNYFRNTRGIQATDTEYKNKVKKLTDYLKSLNKPEVDSKIAAVENVIKSNLEAHNNSYNLYYDIINGIVNNYRNALVKEKLETYEGMLEALENDPMVKLEKLAKEDNRVIYAVAWIILMFETFAVLFMYLKRIIVTMILICLFPVVMAMYVLDKMGDGKSQSLETWFKEFVANTTVQFFHAVIYVLIINLALDAVRADPTRNWFILIIATLALFPTERILRDILGIRSSTLGTLKLSAGAVIGAGIALSRAGAGAVRTGAGAVRGGYNVGKQGISNIKSNYISNMQNGVRGGKFGAGLKAGAQTLGGGIVSGAKKVGKHFENNWNQVTANSTAKHNRKQQYRDSRSQNRRDLAERRKAIIAGGGVHSIGDAITTARAGVAKVTGAASNITGKLRNSGLARGALKVGQAAKFAGKELKFVGGGYRRIAGAAIGAVSAVDATANGGLSAGITAGNNLARTVGGFKPHPKKQNDPKNSTKSKFNPKYNPINNPTGTVSNSNAHLGSGNTPIFHDEERDGDNIQSVLGFDNDRIFTDEERGTNPELTPESVMAGAAGGALVGAALDSTPGHEGVDTPEDGETTVDTNDTSNVEPGEIQNEVTSEATVQSDGSVEVTQTVETTGTGDLSGIDEITAAPETTVIMNEDGSVGLETDSHLELSGDDGDTDLRLRDKLSDDSSDVDPIVR